MWGIKLFILDVLNFVLFTTVFIRLQKIDVMKMFRRATHLHGIPRGLIANGLRAVLRTFHRPKNPPLSWNSNCIVRTYGLSQSVCQKRLSNSRSCLVVRCLRPTYDTERTFIKKILEVFSAGFLEGSLGLLRALKNYGESG